MLVSAFSKVSRKPPLEKQLKKLQIQVPEHLGRSMLGVIDCSGQLQSGQVKYFRNFSSNRVCFRSSFNTPEIADITMLMQILLKLF